MRPALAAAAFLAGMAATLPAQAECRQALALGLDVSGSVDGREYRLQLDGLAAALSHPDVREALLTLPETPVEIAVYEWSGPRYQSLVVPWVRIESRAALERLISALRARGRGGTAAAGAEESKYSGADVMSRRRANDPSTALGRALLYGGELLSARACWAHTLDISGDGKSNTGPRPRDTRADPRLAGVTVNALVIGIGSPHGGDQRQEQIGELWAYFSEEVIRGPDAFVETALGFEDYEAAMVRKLLRELAGLALSELHPEFTRQ